MNRREFLKDTALTCGVLATSGIFSNEVKASEESLPIVYHFKDCTVENLLKALDKVKGNLKGKIAVKIHSGEPHAPNIIPPSWVKKLIEALPNSFAVECNVFYESPRKVTATHRETLKTNGFEIPVDIMDEDGDTLLSVGKGFHLKEVAVGKNLLNYDSLLILTHFKGHTMGGFGGSLKNVAMGCASGKLGKAQVHGVDKQRWSEGSYFTWPTKEWLMEALADSGKAILDHFKGQYACINVLRRMSVDCDCEGITCAEPTTPDLGILASTDILAIDQASVDLVYALPEKDKKDLVERIESRKGLRQLSAMEELGLGSRKYELWEV